MAISDDNQLTFINPADSALAHVGQVANEYAARNVFADYLSRKADNTIRRQAADLARFVEFLNQIGEQTGLHLGAALGEFAQAVAASPDGACGGYLTGPRSISPRFQPDVLFNHDSKKRKRSEPYRNKLCELDFATENALFNIDRL
jgi:hypothetical protein